MLSFNVVHGHDNGIITERVIFAIGGPRYVKSIYVADILSNGYFVRSIWGVWFRLSSLFIIINNKYCNYY